MDQKILARIRAVYPGATSYEVDNLKNVWVHCAPLHGGRRDIPGGTIRLGSSPTTAAIAQDAARIAQVWAEVERGVHDSTQGCRPVHVYVDRDDDVAVVYPAGPGWISWDRKVA